MSRTEKSNAAENMLNTAQVAAEQVVSRSEECNTSNGQYFTTPTSNEHIRDHAVRTRAPNELNNKQFDLARKIHWFHPGTGD